MQRKEQQHKGQEEQSRDCLDLNKRTTTNSQMKHQFLLQDLPFSTTHELEGNNKEEKEESDEPEKGSELARICLRGLEEEYHVKQTGTMVGSKRACFTFVSTMGTPHE